jgi:serine/threonine protein kinase
MLLSEGEHVGPYKITSRIGSGGMGEVWKAFDPRLNRDVAIKISRAGFSTTFQQEARAVAALNHPNICTLYDVGPEYLVMELIDGITLADRLSQGPITLDETLNIARQIAEALNAAHERRVVHRDLKPANIKIRSDSSVKVLDFGLARTEPSQEAIRDSPTLMTQTQPGMLMGTAGYMSPEQARGHSVDKRTDIWAFGIILYEMITGKRPFNGQSIPDVLAATLNEGS